MQEENQQTQATAKSDSKGLLIGGVVVALLILVVGGYSLFSSRSRTSRPAESGSGAGEIEVNGGEFEGELPEMREIVVEASEFEYAPSTITAETGETVRLVFKNVGDTMHDFVIDELSAQTSRIAGGEEEVILFTANQAGEYSFYCSVGNHRQLGMEGTLVVE
jgi:plastocyanin